MMFFGLDVFCKIRFRINIIDIFDVFSKMGIKDFTSLANVKFGGVITC